MDATARRKVEPWAEADDQALTAAEDRDPRSRFISPWAQRHGTVSTFPQPASRKR